MLLVKYVCVCILSYIVRAAYVEFPVSDSSERPTNFSDGLPTYIEVKYENSILPR